MSHTVKPLYRYCWKSGKMIKVASVCHISKNDYRAPKYSLGIDRIIFTYRDLIKYHGLTRQELQNV